MRAGRVDLDGSLILGDSPARVVVLKMWGSGDAIDDTLATIC